MSWTIDGLEYTLRKKITVDHANVDADLTDFPLLVKIVADAEIGAISNADGFDHRFTASDGTTLLKFERESFAIAGGEADAVYWVKVPTIAGSSNTEIYLYYRADDTADGSDKANVWDANFIGVYHFKDGSGTVADNSQGGTDFSLSGSPAWSSTGPAKGSLDFDGVNDNTNAIAAALNAFSCSIIARRDDSIDAYGCLLGFKANYASLTAWNDNNIIFLNILSGGVGTITNKWVDDSAFHYLSFRQAYVDASTITRYFNFDADAKVTYGPAAYDVMTHYKLGDLISGLNRRFKGSIDEFRISNIVRSDAWVKFERANFLEADNEISFGTEEVAPSVPEAPTNLAATAADADTIDLAWDAPDDGGSAIIGYKIERKVGAGDWSTLVADTENDDLEYSDTGLDPATLYTYRVSAINAVGTGDASDEASDTTDAEAPGAPTELAAEAISDTQIDLSWTAPVSNGGAAITGYKIERESPTGGGWSTLVADTGSTDTEYSNTGLTASTEYNYRVSAINSVGASSPSTADAATTNPTPADGGATRRQGINMRMGFGF